MVGLEIRYKEDLMLEHLELRVGGMGRHDSLDSVGFDSWRCGVYSKAAREGYLCMSCVYWPTAVMEEALVTFHKERPVLRGADIVRER